MTDAGGPILAGLNDKQREAVLTVDGPLLVVAGPGSGKTRVLVARMAWLVASGHARPHQILAMTFTNKAAREMLERTEQLMQSAGYAMPMESGRSRLWMGTFHSMFARIIRMNADRIGFTSDFSIYDQQESQQVVKRLLEREGVQSVKPRPVHGFISWAKNRMRTADQIEPKTDVQKVAVSLMGPYQKALRDANAMDFDDLLVKSHQLLNRHEDVLKRCQERWTHVLIDEFQDTNTLQYRLAQMIAQQHQNICAVGDDCQSIYAFRGAEIRNILLFSRDFPKAKIIRLEQNYRSSQNILKLADSVIKHNVGRIDKSLWTTNNEGQKITILSTESGEAEADKVVRQIQQLMLYHSYRRSDFAILYRTNRLSRQFEDALRANGIPYRVYGSLSFYQRKEIKNACAYLRLLVNPNDIAAFLRVVNYPKRGIGDVSQKAVLAFARQSDGGLPNALAHIDRIGIRSAKSRRELLTFRDMLETHAQRLATEEDVVSVIESLLRQSGLWEEIRRDETVVVESRMENLQELVGAIHQHVTQDEGTLSSFLQQVELFTSEDEPDKPTDCVTLMTAHASKGLEFEVVFICGMEDGLFPVTHGQQSVTAPMERATPSMTSPPRLLPAEIDFDNPRVQHLLSMIARLESPESDAKGEDSTVIQAAVERLRKEGPWPAVESVFEHELRQHSDDVGKLQDALARSASDSATIHDVLQCAEALRLHQDVNRVSRANIQQGAAELDACEEERRLFYVAVTRAKSRLYLSWARRRFYAGGVRWGDPSRFFDELDSSVVEQSYSRQRSSSYRTQNQGYQRPTEPRGAPSYSSPSRGVRTRPVRPRRRLAASNVQEFAKGMVDDLGKGDRVSHSMYGAGTVKDLTHSAYGKQAVVQFDGSGEKKLILKYARLEKLG